jgi:hypothetical protein
MNEKTISIIAVICIVVSVAVVFATTAFAYRTGRSADRSAELRVEAEAEYRRLKSGFDRAVATIDEVERGLGEIGSIAAEIEHDNDGAVGVIRTAIEIVERVRLEVAVLEGSIADFRNHDDGSGNTLER